MHRATIFLFLLVMALAIFSLLLGPVYLSPKDIFHGVMLGPFSADIQALIFWHVRVPRIITAILVGAGLGMSGAGLQNITGNHLAEPGLLGASPMAALAAILAISFGAPHLILLAAIFGALLSVILLIGFARHYQDGIGLILFGVGLGALAGAASNLVLSLSPTPFTLSDLLNWLMGSLANRSWTDLSLCGPIILGGLLLVASQSTAMAWLGLGDDVAATSGIHLLAVRRWVILGVGLISGACVALSGVIGFVGLIAPHIARPFYRNDPSKILWPSALIGMVTLLAADFLVRIIPANNEIHIGVLIALIGAPLLAWFSASRKGALL